jgi:hypothetical protein
LFKISGFKYDAMAKGQIPLCFAKTVFHNKKVFYENCLSQYESVKAWKPIMSCEHMPSTWTILN